MKKLLCIIVALACLFTLVGCSAHGDVDNGSTWSFPHQSKSPSANRNGEINDGLNENENADDVPLPQSNRKVYYTADTYLTVEKLDESCQSVKQLLLADEYVERQETSNSYAYLVVRVKTERLDAFLTEVSKLGKQTHFSKSVVDITTQYETTEQKIATLQAELASLQSLYQQATEMKDILEITSRINEVNGMLTQLSNQKNKYDTLVDYSVVTINLRCYDYAYSQDESFGDRILEGLGVTWEVVKWFVVFFISISPLLVVVGGIVFAILMIEKKKKAKRLLLQQQEQEKKTD